MKSTRSKKFDRMRTKVMKPVRAFTAMELKSYNAILAPPIYQKSLATVEAKL